MCKTAHGLNFKVYMKELLTIIRRYGKQIRECTNEPRFIYGEIYGDIVFGALLSAVSDEEKRRILTDMAFEEYRAEEKAMCAALVRWDAAKNAERIAGEKGIAEAVFELFPMEKTNGLFEKINGIAARFQDEINGI